MTQSSIKAAEFYSEVAKRKKLWTIRDEGGFPAPRDFEQKRSVPFWSNRRYVQEIIDKIPDYAKFRPIELSWAEFVSKWVPGLSKDGLSIGLNWSGDQATGYDVKPEVVVRNIEQISSREALDA